MCTFILNKQLNGNVFVSFTATAEEKTTQDNWQAMEMKNNTAYISTTHNMLTEDNIAYYYGQARTQIPTENGIECDHSGDQIPTEDNTAYGSTHLQDPIATDDNPAYVITKDNGNNSTSDQNQPSEEAIIYWEPADDVNELYHQLSTNKYRDIKSSQIKQV